MRTVSLYAGQGSDILIRDAMYHCHYMLDSHYLRVRVCTCITMLMAPCKVSLHRYPFRVWSLGVM